MAIIGTRKLNVAVSAKEWELLRYPLKIEDRMKHPRWKLENVSSFGPDVYLEFSVFGKFWKDLDEVFSIYVPNWEKLDVQEVHYVYFTIIGNPCSWGHSPGSVSAFYLCSISPLSLGRGRSSVALVSSQVVAFRPSDFSGGFSLCLFCPVYSLYRAFSFALVISPG